MRSVVKLYLRKRRSEIRTLKIAAQVIQNHQAFLKMVRNGFLNVKAIFVTCL